MVTEELRGTVELIAALISLVAVATIVIAVVYSVLRYLYQVISHGPGRKEDYDSFRKSLARALILGLEILVAADIVETVALDSSLDSVFVLGLLVLIRTFLSWSLAVEVEGRWPWQPKIQAAEPN